MNYFKVLQMTPDCFLGFGRKAPALLKLEAWIVKAALTLRCTSTALILVAVACYSGVTVSGEPMLTTALTVSAIAMQLMAYVLCMWLIYRLSKQATRSEFDWCEERFKSIQMPAPFRHMNRYVLASYVDAEVRSRMHQPGTSLTTESKGEP